MDDDTNILMNIVENGTYYSKLLLDYPDNCLIMSHGPEKMMIA